MFLRALWPDSNPHDIKDWKPFSEDLLRFLSSHETAPVIGVGHSIGAIVTLRAALSAPDKFRALVLIDPVLFTPRRLIWNPSAISLPDCTHDCRIVQAKTNLRRSDNVFRVIEIANISVYER
jgi:pimeloyl-ACP methyl ester carboxylesterase